MIRALSTNFFADWYARNWLLLMGYLRLSTSVSNSQLDSGIELGIEF